MANLAMREAYGRALAEYGAVHPKVVALDVDTASSTLSSFFEKRFPDRFFNFGIAEPCMIDAAVGLALAGMVPFANAFAALASLRALEQVRTCVCYASTNVKIASSYAGVSDFKDGPTHHAISDIAIMRSLPEMTVIVPADGNEAATFVPLIAEFDGPVYFRLNRAATLPVSSSGEALSIGKGIVRRQGKDLTIVACGSMTGRSMQAGDALASKEVQARVIEMHTIKPLDVELILQAADDTGAIVTAEEHTVIGGLGSAVAEALAVRPVPLYRVGIKDTFARTGPDPESIMDAYSMGVSDIVNAAISLIVRKKS
ncbi:MAG: transketolase C-terminal domain-containing protein [Dehalococcoidia bacterium]|nr:transketolase C-terminal domain-containing protein [Dehalococcoidia bacterium]